MKISRHGSGADHGTVTRGLAPKIKWDAENDCLVFQDICVRDFNTPAHHDYEVRVTLEEFADAIKVVGGRGIRESADAIDEAMAPACRALLRLVSLLSGTLAPALQGAESDN